MPETQPTDQQPTIQGPVNRYGGPTLSPLQQSDCECLDNIIEKMVEVGQLLNACQSCQIDVSSRIGELERIHQIASDLRRVFFPQVG